MKKRNLHVNEPKTENNTVKREGPGDLKKCKYLVSLLDSAEDIKRRKQLARAVFIHHKHTLTSSKITLKIRIRIFNAYITSIFSYNSELWTFTKKMEQQIDTFQGNLLQKMLNIKWSHKIPNEDLYNRTNQEKWSAEIRLRRLKWFDHLMRLPEESPARLALEETLRIVNRPQGRPKTTRISMMNGELKKINSQFYIGSPHLAEETNNRKRWNCLFRL